MSHAKNAVRQESETTVVKANRKHQILLNMEVHRIEMEKKMRERYFYFEMTLMKARRLKIVDRQKSLGIYHPHPGLDNSRGRKGTGDSFFFTQPVITQSGVKLPPVFGRQDTRDGLNTKLANSKLAPKIYELSKNIYQGAKLDKGQGQRPHLERRRERPGKTDGQTLSYSQTKEGVVRLNKKQSHQRMMHPPSNSQKVMTKEREGLKQLESKEASGTSKLFDLESRRKDQPEISAVDAVQRENRLTEAMQGEIPEGKPQGNDSIPLKEAGNQREDPSKESHLIESTSSAVYNGENSQQQTGSGNVGDAQQGESDSAKAKHTRNFVNFQELQVWRAGLGQSMHELKAISRSMSVTGYREDAELSRPDLAISVRPQSALARL